MPHQVVPSTNTHLTAHVAFFVYRLICQSDCLFAQRRHTRYDAVQPDNQTDRQTTDRQKDKRAARQAEHCQRAKSQVDQMVHDGAR